MKRYEHRGHAVPFQPRRGGLFWLLLALPFAIALRMCDRAANYRGRSDD